MILDIWGPGHDGRYIVTMECTGPNWADKCPGFWKDPSGDGHGGLNGGSWEHCIACGGYGKEKVWMTEAQLQKYFDD